MYRSQTLRQYAFTLSQVFLTLSFVLGVDLVFRWQSMTRGLHGFESLGMIAMVLLPTSIIAAVVSVPIIAVVRLVGAHSSKWSERLSGAWRSCLVLAVMWAHAFTLTRAANSAAYRLGNTGGVFAARERLLALALLIVGVAILMVLHRWWRRHVDECLARNNRAEMIGALLALFSAFSVMGLLAFISLGLRPSPDGMATLGPFRVLPFAYVLFVVYAIVYRKTIARLMDAWRAFVFSAATVIGVSAAIVLVAVLGGSQAMAPIDMRSGDRSAHPNVKNVIFVTFDGLAANRMSLYGNTRKTTPNIDAFADTSYVFDRAYAESDSTPQSLLAIHTGLHSRTDRIVEYGSIRAGGEVIGYMPELFERLGWDAVYGFQLPWHREDLFTYIGAYNDDFGPLATYNHGGRRRQALLRWNLRHPQLPSAWLDFFYETLAQPYVSRRQSSSDILSFGFDCRSADGIAQPFTAGQRYLTERASSSSFLWIHEVAPHEPYCSVPGYAGTFTRTDARYNTILDRLAIRDLPIPPEQERYWPYKPIVARLAFWDLPIPPEEQESMYATMVLYEEFLLAADAQFGKFLEYLKASGRFDDSMIIVSADHGQAFEKGDIWNSTRVMYEQTARVPLIIHMPGQQRGRRVSTLAHGVDIMPTIIETLGYTPPDWMDGESLWSYLDDGERGESRVIVSRVLPTLAGFFASDVHKRTHTFLIYRGPYKFIHRYYGDDNLQAIAPPDAARRYFDAFPHVELYDLNNDPEERQNIAPDHPRLVDEFMQMVRDEIEAARSARGRPSKRAGG